MSDKLASRGPRQLSGPFEAPVRRERWSAAGTAGFSLEDLRLPESSGEELPSGDRTSRVVAIAPSGTRAKAGGTVPAPVPAESKPSKVLLAAFAAASGVVLFIAFGGPSGARPASPVEPAAPAAQPLVLEARQAANRSAAGTATSDASSSTSVTPGPAFAIPAERLEPAVPPSPGARKPDAPVARRSLITRAAANSVLERPIAPPDD